MFMRMYLVKYTPSPVSIISPAIPSAKFGKDNKNILKKRGASLFKTLGRISLKTMYSAITNSCIRLNLRISLTFNKPRKFLRREFHSVDASHN